MRRRDEPMGARVSAEQTRPEGPATTRLERWFVPALLAVCAVGLVLGAFMLAEFVARNPIAGGG